MFDSREWDIRKVLPVSAGLAVGAGQIILALRVALTVSPVVAKGLGQQRLLALEDSPVEPTESEVQVQFPQVLLE
jgi:hypothetical protein